LLLAPTYIVAMCSQRCRYTMSLDKP
jgi:hypothetical protein